MCRAPTLEEAAAKYLKVVDQVLRHLLASPNEVHGALAHEEVAHPRSEGGLEDRLRPSPAGRRSPAKPASAGGAATPRDSDNEEHPAREPDPSRGGVTE